MVVMCFSLLKPTTVPYPTFLIFQDTFEVLMSTVLQTVPNLDCFDFFLMIRLETLCKLENMESKS
jgi:hypothetical protein